jgi:hypothetical protein
MRVEGWYFVCCLLHLRTSTPHNEHNEHIGLSVVPFTDTHQRSHKPVSFSFNMAHRSCVLFYLSAATSTLNDWIRIFRAAYYRRVQANHITLTKNIWLLVDVSIPVRSNEHIGLHEKFCVRHITEAYKQMTQLTTHKTLTKNTLVFFALFSFSDPQERAHRLV